MAHKSFGGWFFNKTVYAKFKIANELWYTTVDNKRYTHLFSISWMKVEDLDPSVLVINFLVISINLGVVFS